MKLTRKKAIELCIEAWTIHAETGCTKKELPEKHREIDNACWFCEYDNQRRKRYNYKREDCYYCPLTKHYKDGCTGSFFEKWKWATTPRTRKKYAKLFLAQIKSLRKSK